MWIPFLEGMARGMGFEQGSIFPFVFWTYIIACAGTAFVISVNKVQHPQAPKMLQTYPIPSVPSRTVYTPPPSPPQQVSQRIPLFGSPGGSVVASKIRHIYHRPTCEWVLKMSQRNRQSFNSAQNAMSRGYRPCRVCKP
jgi:hypothetical protein